MDTRHIESAFAASRAALEAFVERPGTYEAVGAGAKLLISAFEGGGRVISCGNGGSMCDAMHFAQELSGRYRLDRPPLAAIAISDAAHLTCVANDYGYDEVFARFVTAMARPNDCLLAISTSGRSRNVINAADAARRAGASVIALTGSSGSPLGEYADVHISTPDGHYADRTQELHIKVIHVLIELVEKHLFHGLNAE